MLREFMQFEAAGGMVLLVAALLALGIANSPYADQYFSLLETHLGPLSVLHWVNDGLMALFFLLVGLEIKHEVIRGELATAQQRLLPGLCALAGMVGPALIYVAFNWHDSVLLKGWAIPSATDIAFALGILSLLGERVPTSLKVFLTALAIIDDLGAVLIIALFYGGDLAWGYLGLAVLTLAILMVMNRARVTALWLYMILGFFLWLFIHQSGIHSTLAGVLLAFTIPLVVPTEGEDEPDDSPLHRLENRLDRVVPFVIVPLFGFANAGVSFRGFQPSELTEPLTLGISLGLLMGKSIGICLITFVLIKMGKATLPDGANWFQFIGLSFLCGVGFTMSLFISMLGFAGHPEMQEGAKVGILLGSFCSGIVGALFLHRAHSQRLAQEDQSVRHESDC